MHSPLLFWLSSAVIVLSISVFLLARSEIGHRKLVAIRKKRVCRRRQRLQDSIEEHKDLIGFHVNCRVEGPVKLFTDWMAFKVGIPMTQCDQHRRKLIRIIIDKGPVFKAANIVRMTIIWPPGKIHHEFFWTMTRKRICDIAMREYMLTELERILCKIPNKEAMALIVAFQSGTGVPPS